MGDKVAKLLIVEDETDILHLLQFNFEREGFETHTARDGNEALRLAEERKPDLIVLDLLLPGRDGLEVCKTLKSREGSRNTPVIMLTAKGEEQDRITGFELGADDYVVKPFSPKELILRVKAVLRRKQERQDEGTVWEHKGLRVEFEAYRVFVDGAEIDLTATEFNLLTALIHAENRVLTREQLLDKVWGYEFVGYARTVDTHMHRLRLKLGPYADWIQTVRGVGYRLKRE
jgi:two-component system phosphate regulon response regulator PhoB